MFKYTKAITAGDKVTAKASADGVTVYFCSGGRAYSVEVENLTGTPVVGTRVSQGFYSQVTPLGDRHLNLSYMNVTVE